MLPPAPPPSEDLGLVEAAGDDVGVGRPDPAPPVHDATVTVTLPGPHPGATHYEIAWGCIRNNVTDPSVPQTFSVVDDCASYPRLDLLALAFDVQAGDLVAFAQQWVDPLEDGNHVVEIFNWDTSFSTAQFTLENTPADISQVSAVVDIGSWSEQGDATVSEGSGGTIAFEYPQTFQRQRHIVSSGFADAGFTSHTWVSSSPPSNVNLDLTDGLIPHVVEVAVDAKDPLRPRVSWALAHEGAQADRVTVRLSWVSGGDTTSWSMVVPPDLTDVQVPALPGSIAGAPTAAVTYQTPSVELEAASYLDGYDDARNIIDVPSSVSTYTEAQSYSGLGI